MRFGIERVICCSCQLVAWWVWLVDGVCRMWLPGDGFGSSLLDGLAAAGMVAWLAYYVWCVGHVRWSPVVCVAPGLWPVGWYSQ